MAKFYVICHVILCRDMTIYHDMRFISEVLRMRRVSDFITLVCWYLAVHVTLHKQQYKSNLLHSVSASCVFR